MIIRHNLCSYERGNFADRYTQIGECHVKMKPEIAVMQPEIGVMLPLAKECQRLPASLQELGERCGSDSPSQLSQGTSPSDPLISDIYLQNHDTIPFVVLATWFVVLIMTTLTNATTSL